MQMVAEMPFMSENAIAAATERFISAQESGIRLEIGSLQLEPDEDVGNFAGFTVGVRVTYLTTEQQIAAALREKLARYRQDVVGDQPFVVGLCAGDPSISTEAVRTALYGTERLHMLSDKTTAAIVKHWVVREGGLFKDPENRHMSAVVHCKFDLLNPEEIHCEVLHNPLASFPLPDNLFPWPQTNWLEPNDVERLMVTQAGDSRMRL
jgi:hypothetical protein